MKINKRLIFLNIGITFGFLFTLNFLSSGLLWLVPSVEALFQEDKSSPYADNRANLPNYSNDQAFAKAHFQEFAQLATQYEAFIGWSRKPFTGQTINIDADGNRQHQNIGEIGKLVTEGITEDKSVYFFGGSTMWGTGASDTGTIPALFSSISQQPTFNQGETAFTSRQSLAKLINLTAAQADIDIVVFYDGVNDIVHLCRTEHKVNEHGRAAFFRDSLSSEHETQEHEENDFLQYLDFMLLRGTQHLAARVSLKLFPSKSNLSLDQAMNCDNQPEKAQKIAEALVSNWEMAQALSAAKGLEFIAILQPVAFMGEAKVEHLKLNSKFEKERRKQFNAVYPIVQDLIQARRHKWILDYTDVLSLDEYIYVDFCHVSENGNRIISAQLYQDFVDRKFISKTLETALEPPKAL